MVKTFDLSQEPSEPHRGKLGGARRRRKARNALDGWLVLDKPVGLTSTQALGAVKRLLAPEKAGHAGTLDPLASGLLPLAFGEATKTVPFVVDAHKTYRFTVRFGEATDTDDADGKVVATSPVRPSRAAIEDALGAFRGAVEQVPPQFSAIKVNGERAYDLAREGEAVTLKARTVTITRLEIVDEAGPDTVILEADCGKGTYVRSLARDLAGALGTVGHVSALRRTRVGPFGEADMVGLDALRARAPDLPAAVDALVRPPAAALAGVPCVDVDRVTASRLRSGQPAVLRPLGASPEAEVGALHAGDLVALCRAQEGALHPVRVFRSPRRRITVIPSEPPSSCATSSSTSASPSAAAAPSPPASPGSSAS